MFVVRSVDIGGIHIGRQLVVLLTSVKPADGRRTDGRKKYANKSILFIKSLEIEIKAYLPDHVEALGCVVDPGKESVGGRDGDGEAIRVLNPAIAAVRLL